MMEKDPVCGMDVNPQESAGTSEYNGKTYYFCAPGCKRAFDKDPERYVGTQAQHGHTHDHSGHQH